MKIEYTKKSDYLIPNLILKKQKHITSLGKYALLRLKYIKNHKKAFYTILLTKERLYDYLLNIDEISNNEFERLTNELIKLNGITEDLKASNQLEWVGLMNNIHNSAEEIILTKYIYC